MSKFNANTALALFNRTQGRGDIFSFHFEDGAGLAALPKEQFANILLPLFRWWATGSEEKPSNPLELMMFERLKAHQVENAIKRGETLEKLRDNASKGGRPKASDTTEENQKETKCKPNANQKVVKQDKRPSTEEESLVKRETSSSAGDRMQDGLTPPAPAPDSVEDAKKTKAMYAPDYTSNKELLLPNGFLQPKWRMFMDDKFDGISALIAVAEDIMPDAMKGIGGFVEDLKEGLAEIEDMTAPIRKNPAGDFLYAVDKAFDKIVSTYTANDQDNGYALAEDVFKKCLLSARCAIAKVNPDKPTAFVVARLNKVIDAVKILQGA